MQKSPNNSNPLPNDEFVRLFVGNQRRIHGFIATLLPHGADAEEVLQETSIVAWRKFGEFEPGSNFVSWACSIARFEVRRFLRERRRSGFVFSDALLDDLAQRQLDAQEQNEHQHAALQACLQKLRAIDRALLRDCYAEDASFKQVAAKHERPANTVYKALQRIRSALLVCIQRKLSAEGCAS